MTFVLADMYAGGVIGSNACFLFMLNLTHSFPTVIICIALLFLLWYLGKRFI